MTFTSGQILTAAQLNDFSTDSLVVDTDVLVVDKTNDRVGIGTPSPSAPLHVSSGADNIGVLVESTDATARLNLRDNSTSGNSYVGIGAVGDDLSLWADNGKRMTIVGSNVGIGTPSPGKVLDIHGAGTVEARMVSTDGGDTALLFGDNTDTIRASVKYDTSEDRLEFRGYNNVERMVINSIGRVGIGTTSPSTTLDVNGSLSKNSGSFKIPHPLPEMTETHHLVHSFVEAPQADNIYRGRVALEGGSASVDIDEVAGMTAGTFVLLNRDVQAFTSNETGPCRVWSSVSDGVLTITAEHDDCDHEISWLVIGERQDQHMYDTEWTDEHGRVIVEPVRMVEPEARIAALEAATLEAA